MKIKVGVIYGGNTVEHEISVITAVHAMGRFNKEKYEVVPIYITKDLEWYTGKSLLDLENYKDIELLKRNSKNIVLYQKNKRFILQSKSFMKNIVNEIDIAFPIVHGVNVEDGTLAGYLAMLGIKSTFSDIYASTVCQDKVFMKQILSSASLPITKYIWFFDKEYEDNKKSILKEVNTLNYPVIVKPAKLGSSIGIKKVTSESDLENAIEEAIVFDTKIIVEEFVDNLVEVNCSVLGNYESAETSVIEEVTGKDEILSFEDKYVGNGKGKTSSKGMRATNRIIPARIDSDMKKSIEKYALDAFKTLNSSGLVRIDFLINKKSNSIYINEVNTIPGDLSSYLWKASNISYDVLLEKLISIAIKTQRHKDEKVYSFETNILKDWDKIHGSKGK